MDTDYLRMCAIEYGEVTPLEALMLNVHPGVESRLTEMLTNRVFGNRHVMANTCREALEDLPAEALGLAGLVGAAVGDENLRDIVEYLNHIVFSQARVDILKQDGGKQAADRAGLPVRPAAPYFSAENGVTEEAVRKLLGECAEDYRERLRSDVSVMRVALDAWDSRKDRIQEELKVLVAGHLATEKGVRALASGAGSQNSAVSAQACVTYTKASSKAAGALQAVVQDARRSIKKATKLFQKMGRERVLVDFVAGDSIEISHPTSDLKFSVSALAGQLVNRSRKDFGSHTPFTLKVFTKTNVEIGKLCVYFSDTPVLDQLLALILFIESGNEEEILEKANLFSAASTETLKAVSTRSPALSRKIEQYTAPASVRNSAFRAIAEDPYMVAVAWWDRTCKRQVEQWIHSWLEDVAVGMHQCFARGREAKDLFESLAKQGGYIPTLFQPYFARLPRVQVL